ncbi:MAG: hypothetical protein L0219_17210 [Phycisphaerales bacterium]|nr:hypothetical protein [Phycisphaerales bacterium]
MSGRDPNFRNPKRVRLTIACVYLDNYYKSDDQGVIRKAKEMLDEHNLELDMWPDNGQKFAYNTLAFGYDIIPHEEEVYKKLRNAVDAKIKQGGCSFILPMPVVFCQFKHPGHGVVPPHMKKLTDACLISVMANPDKVTLLHEMGHGAGLNHERGDANKLNYMHEVDGRSQMYRYQVEKMAKAMYAVG